MSQANLISYIYNPANQTSKEITENFVIRLKEFEKIFNDLKTSEMDYPEQHYLILGQRGYGKTTLLLKIYNEIRNSKKLDKKYCAIVFNEEEYNIRRLERLWEQTAEYLSDYKGFENLYDQMIKHEDKDNYEDIAFNILDENLKTNNKKLILLIDNITDILKKFSNNEAQKLREILLTNNNIRIIGTSSTALEHNFEYDKPFYEFFKIIDLKGLNKEDTIHLLLKLSETYNNKSVKEIIEEKPQRVETLRRITGGVPRTIVLLFEIFADDKEGNSFKDLEVILDRVTPLYKHRMDDLSPPQQEIVDVIAMAWDAVNTKYISQKTRMESKVVSAQLKEIEKNKIINKINTSTKNHLYQISERFFNIWYLMRYGRKKDKDRVKWLVSFLDSWCDKKELNKRALKHIEMLSNNDVNENFALYMTQALAKTKLDMNKQNKLIEETKKFLETKNSNMIKQLPISDLKLMEEVTDYFNNEQFKDALKMLTSISNKTKPIKSLIKIIQSYLYDTDNLDQLLYITDYFFKTSQFNKFNKYIKLIYRKDKGSLILLLISYILNNKNIKTNYIYEMIEEMSQLDDYILLNTFLIIIESKKKNEVDLSFIEKILETSVRNNKNNISLFNLLFIYFIEKINPIKSLELAKFFFDSENSLELLMLNLILIWNNDIQTTEKFIPKIIKDEGNKEYKVSLYLVLNLLIAKKQYNYVYQLFQNEEYNLKEKYKPIYYALMYFMKDQYPDEYLKMGSELKETVKEVIEKINQMSIDYN